MHTASAQLSFRRALLPLRNVARAPLYAQFSPIFTQNIVFTLLLAYNNKDSYYALRTIRYRHVTYNTLSVYYVRFICVFLLKTVFNYNILIITYIIMISLYVSTKELGAYPKLGLTRFPSL